MQLTQPLPINSKFDSLNANPDYSMTAPLNGDGSNFPCKGYLNAPGKHVTAQYVAGNTYSIAVEGTATHGGGSCQLSLSYDNGATFKVIHSILGGCPLQAGYNFVMPSGLPSGKNVVFSWTWFNKIGNREMYQNCALVDVQGSGTSQFVSSLPDMFVANVNKGCGTIEGTEVVFPDPGKSVQFGGTYANGQVGGLLGAGISGTCGKTGTLPPAQSPAATSTKQAQSTSAPTTLLAPPVPSSTKVAPGTGGSCSSGTIQCTSSTTWSMCSGGVFVNMGSVAPGTVCLNGQMVAASQDNVAAANAGNVQPNQATPTTSSVNGGRPVRPAAVTTAPACRVVVKREYRPVCEAFSTRCESGTLQLCDAGTWLDQADSCDATEFAKTCTGTGIVCSADGTAFTLCNGSQLMQVPSGTRCVMTQIGGGIVSWQYEHQFDTL
jgi:hypothetical protein